MIAMEPITLMGYRCRRCGHQWVPRASAAEPPRVCPKCKSPYWDRERIREKKSKREAS